MLRLFKTKLLKSVVDLKQMKQRHEFRNKGARGETNPLKFVSLKTSPDSPLKPGAEHENISCEHRRLLVKTTYEVMGCFYKDSKCTEMSVLELEQTTNKQKST